MANFKLVNDQEGDWVGLYVEDELVYEQHNIDPARMLKLIMDHGPMTEYSIHEAVIDGSLERNFSNVEIIG